MSLNSCEECAGVVGASGSIVHSGRRWLQVGRNVCMALIDELPSAICTLLTRTAMALVLPLTRIGRTHSVMMAGGALSAAFAHDANKTVWFRTNSEIDLVYLGQILV